MIPLRLRLFTVFLMGLTCNPYCHCEESRPPQADRDDEAISVLSIIESCIDNILLSLTSASLKSRDCHASLAMTA